MLTPAEPELIAAEPRLTVAEPELTEAEPELTEAEPELTPAGPALTPPTPQLVLVSGPPASGKTTLARPLAAELGFALLAKDRIKEALHDALGFDADLAWSRRLGAATMELLWALAADAPAVVLEANFWPDDPRHGERARALGARIVEVHCLCPIEECQSRYAARAASRHPVHVLDRELGLAAGAPHSGGSAAPAVPVPTAEPSAAAFARAARPLQLGPVVSVDTTQPVDVAALAQTVRQLLRA